MSDARSHSEYERLNRSIPIEVLDLFDTSWTASGDLDTYLNGVLDRCTAWFGASGGSLFLQTESPDRFALAARSGSQSKVPDDAEVVAGQGIAGACVLSRTPLLVGDVDSHPYLSKVVQNRNPHIGSALVVPLLTTEGDCVGVLNLSRGADGRAFSEPELHLANSIAGHIALAVSNGRLLSRLRLEIMRSEGLSQRLEVVLQTLAVGVIVFDAQGHVENWNSESQAFLDGSLTHGMTADRLVELAPEAIRDTLSRLIRDSLAGEKSKAFAHDRSADRSWSLSASPVSGGGATLAIHDATEHERMTREVHRVRRLAEIGQMTAAIAHEIRNPLHAMRGAAQLIQSAPEHAEEFGKIIEAEVDKLNDLCSDFLEFARPLELHLHPVDLGDLISGLADRHRLQFEEAGVTLNVAVEGDMAPVSADRNRLEQVVRNLLLNALQATPSGGTVNISARRSEIVVQDDGAGMEQNTLERLFTPFFTTKASGTGLGLSTARKIVDAHGGAIEVESEVGKGTRLRIALEEQAA